MIRRFHFIVGTWSSTPFWFRMRHSARWHLPPFRAHPKGVGLTFLSIVWTGRMIFPFGTMKFTPDAAVTELYGVDCKTNHDPIGEVESPFPFLPPSNYFPVIRTFFYFSHSCFLQIWTQLNNSYYQIQVWPLRCITFKITSVNEVN
jgi:hypothetical protein